MYLHGPTTVSHKYIYNKLRQISQAKYQYKSRESLNECITTSRNCTYCRGLEPTLRDNKILQSPYASLLEDVAWLVEQKLATLVEG